MKTLTFKITHHIKVSLNPKYRAYLRGAWLPEWLPVACLCKYGTLVPFTGYAKGIFKICLEYQTLTCVSEEVFTDTGGNGQAFTGASAVLCSLRGRQT